MDTGEVGRPGAVVLRAVEVVLNPSPGPVTLLLQHMVGATVMVTALNREIATQRHVLFLVGQIASKYEILIINSSRWTLGILDSLDQLLQNLWRRLSIPVQVL